MLRVGVQPDGTAIEQHHFMVHFTLSTLKRAGVRQRAEDNGIRKKKLGNGHSEGHTERQSFMWADEREKDSGGMID